MARVNIITRTTAKGIGKQELVGGLMVEEIVNGKPKQYEHFLYRESMTSYEVTLQLLANALTIVKRSENDYESISIYTDVELVNTAFKNKWFEKWHDAEWKNAKGEQIANSEEWQHLWKLLYPLAERYSITDSYSRWGGTLLMHCEKELENHRYHQLVDENVNRVKERLENDNE